MLMAQKLKMNDGKVAAIDGGVEVPLTEFISNLKNPWVWLRALLLQVPVSPAWAPALDRHH